MKNFCSLKFLKITTLLRKFLKQFIKPILYQIINIVNYDTESYGTTYSAYAELICSLKTDRGTILPEFFTINDLGDRPEGCPTRTVNLNEDYVIFLTKFEPIN